LVSILIDQQIEVEASLTSQIKCLEAQ
jgi:hypothetical protein